MPQQNIRYDLIYICDILYELDKCPFLVSISIIYHNIGILYIFQATNPGPINKSPKTVNDDQDEVAYADADYKDLYEFGPVSYKNVSQEAAARKKAEITTRFNTPRYQPTSPPQ